MTGFHEKSDEHGFCKGQKFLDWVKYELFYIRGSVHCNSRLKKSNEMQQYADIYLLLYYFTCLGCPSHLKHVE